MKKGVEFKALRVSVLDRVFEAALLRSRGFKYGCQIFIVWGLPAQASLKLRDFSHNPAQFPILTWNPKPSSPHRQNEKAHVLKVLNKEGESETLEMT